MTKLATAGSTGMGKFSPYTRLCWNRSGTTLVVGQPVMLVMDAVDADVVEGDVADGRPGMASAIESNVQLPEGAFLGYGIFGFVDSLQSGAGADNTKVAVTFSGEGQVLADNGSAAAAGDAIYLADAGTAFLHAAATSGQKYLGYLREATTGTGAATVLVSAMFDGFNGIGQAPES